MSITHQSSQLRDATAMAHSRIAKTLLTLMLATLLLLATTESLQARHSPTRHDRRPDRETRIRYPRTRPQSGSRERRTTLHSAPPSTSSPSSSGASEPESTAPSAADTD